MYEFDVKEEINYLFTHGRPILLEVFGEGKGKGEVGEQNNGSLCKSVDEIAKKYGTLFNYVCFVGDIKDLGITAANKNEKLLYFIVNSIDNKVKIT